MSRSISGSTRVGSASVAVASLIAISGVTVPAAALECARDNDCPGDLICDGGQCMRQDGTAPSPAELSGAPPAAAPGPPAAAPAPGAPKVMVKTPAATPQVVTTKLSFYSEDPNGLDRVTHVQSGQACNTPCALEVPPGFQNFEVKGTGGELEMPIMVELGQPKSFEIVHFNPGRFWVGMGMFVGGLAATVPGIVLAITGAEDGEAAPGVVLAVVGGATFIVGEVLWLTALGHISGDDRPPVEVGAAPLPGGGATGALRLSF